MNLRRRFALLAFWLQAFWLPGTLFGWQSGEPAAVLRSETRAVQIDVSVKDKAGNPILDLHRDDFSVWDNGKPRRIQIFSKYGDADVTAGRPEGPAGQLTVIVLDGLNSEFMDQSYARDQAIKTVQRMGLNEMMAVLALTPDLKFQKFTRKRELLLAAIRGFRPNLPPYPIRQRIQVTLAAFQRLADNMSEAPGHKSIIWITGGFPEIRAYNAAIRRALNRINDLKVAIYAVDARGLLLESGLRNIFTMDQFADYTGGEAYYNRNDVSVAIEEAAAASKLSYMVGFYLTDNDRDQGVRGLKVEVNRPGAVLHYRRSYSAAVH